MQKKQAEKILKKSYRILALSTALFLLVAVSFAWRFSASQKQTVNSTNAKTDFSVQPLSPQFSSSPASGDNGQSLNGYPVPESFKHFQYNPKGNQNLPVNIKCADAYAVVMIFPAGVDYRANPSSARLNKAFSCSLGQETMENIDLSILNLPSGAYYYMMADQGLTGEWYNPR
jgi:hypothetical protein